MDFKDGVPFDPGFVQHVSAFVPNIQFAYNSLAQYRNFGQKKMQFKMYFPKIQKMLRNYEGFYLGCILWAMYIKQFDNKPVLDNLCIGGEYNETDTLSEVNFILQYLEQLPKDVKYYLGQNYSVDENDLKIINAYREFLLINQGFVKTDNTNDIKIPESLKTPSNLEEVLAEIEKVVDTGKLEDLLPFAEKVI